MGGGREGGGKNERKNGRRGRERKERKEGREKEVGGERRKGEGEKEGGRKEDKTSGHTVQISAWSLMKEKDSPGLLSPP